MPVTIDVLRNDVDPSGERPRLAGEPGCAGGGTAIVTTDDSRVTFTPRRGGPAVFSCTYEVTNSQGLPANATIVDQRDRRRRRSTSRRSSATRTVTVDIGETVRRSTCSPTTATPTVRRARCACCRPPRRSLGQADRDGDMITFIAGTVRGHHVDHLSGRRRRRRRDHRPRRRSGSSSPTREPPIAVDDAGRSPVPGVPTTFDVLANDVDPDGSNADLSLVSVHRRHRRRHGARNGADRDARRRQPTSSATSSPPTRSTDSDGLTDTAHGDPDRAARSRTGRRSPATTRPRSSAEAR